MSACAYAQSDQSLSKSLEYSMTVKLLTEHHSNHYRDQTRFSMHLNICWTPRVVSKPEPENHV